MFLAEEKPRDEGQTEKHHPKRLTAVLGETKNREEGTVTKWVHFSEMKNDVGPQNERGG